VVWLRLLILSFSNGCQLLLVYTQGLGEHGPPVALADRDSG
jgi:hypothetical protein